MDQHKTSHTGKRALCLIAKHKFQTSDLQAQGLCAQLERIWAQWQKQKYALALSSGTAAIHAALLAIHTKPGDEIITTPYSWIQTISPILFCGATPVFADIDPNTWHLDPHSVQKRISNNTKAILVAHLFGHIADMRALKNIAQKAGIHLIADAAQTCDASLHGKPVASWADITCFSLGRGKLVSAGEGGILLTNQRRLFLNAVQLTQHPQRFFFHTGNPPNYMPLNYRIHPWIAALALADFEKRKQRKRHRQLIYDIFQQYLRKQTYLKPQKTMPGEKPEAYGLPLSCLILDRQKLCHQAQRAGLPCLPGPVQTPLHLKLAKLTYPKIPKHQTYQPGACPNAEQRCQKQEIYALSPLDMDELSRKKAENIAKLMLKTIARAAS